MDERVILYFSGQLSKEERIQLLKEREKNTQLKEDFATMQNLYGITYLSQTETDPQKEEKKYIQLRHKQIKKRIWKISKHSISYAAVILITFIISQHFFSHSSTSSIHSFPEEETVAAELELYVPSGQRARITLPDGSTAWLNAGSTLHYPSVFEKERKVRLQGEGFFDIVKDEKKPFIVSTENVDIEALGTQFNVRNYPQTKMCNTMLVDGAVRIYKPNIESPGVILEPNQQLTYKDNKFILNKSIDKDDLLWKEGIYNFKKARLDHIVKKLELYYDVEIIVKDPRILQYEYTGKFRQRDGVMEILRIIQKIHKFKIYKNDELNQVTISL